MPDATDPEPPRRQTPRHAFIAAKTRVNVALLAGVVGGAVAAPFVPWQLSVLIGWIAAATVMLVWLWAGISGLNALQTQEVSTAEDSSRHTVTLIVVVAAIVSLGGVVLALAKARDVTLPMETALTVAALVTIVLSWTTVHTMFTVRYAHLYYSAVPGGINFNEETPPDYRDFAYLAFTVGMTFQVSDTNIEDRLIRRAVTRQALVSYVFGTVIVGMTINVLAGFIR